jgi:hypothetical protein
MVNWRGVLRAGVGVAISTSLVAGCAQSVATPPQQSSPVTLTTPSPTASPVPTVSPTPRPVRGPVSFSATGDIILGDVNGRLPRNDGNGLFAAVRDALSADVVMGNMDGTLTDDTGYSKCGSDTTSCYAFRAPPAYARHLFEGGFDVITQANNHSWDFGEQGYRNTGAALAFVGIEQTGLPGEVTMLDVNGVRVAVIGYSPYLMHNKVNRVPLAAGLVRKTAAVADLVIVQAHMGAEGADKIRTVPGVEWYYGENRGDPIKFSRAMIDAGADLVVGHGPHVLRGMEFYKGKLIAYSLGNFAGAGRTLQRTGPLGLGGILKVNLLSDGTWSGGYFQGTYMDADGWPQLDYSGQALNQVRWLSQADFGPSAANFDQNGAILAPTN